MKKTNTKSALLMSIVSLVLCCAMLIGTTFAWFTDTATSGANKIQAGNLDIEVSYKDGTEWKSIEGSDSLFDKEALWEPGHTEFVTLKVENKGTLALKYQVNVSPISETGGINVYDESFKLSDYLVFGTSTPSETETVYAQNDDGRKQARAAVGTTLKLNQAGLTKAGTLLAKAENAENNPAQYITLVVYMPETVDNHANYKTGTTPPQINLGIKVVATQLASEADTFGNNYDGDVDYDAADNTIEYNYFPQINVTGQLEIKTGGEVAKGSTAGAETSVTKINDTTSKVVLASAEKVDDNTAAKLEVTVNKGELEEDETGSLTLKVVKDDTANANFQTKQDSPVDTTKQDSTTYQVTVECEGVVAQAPETGKALYKVDLFIGKNRTNVKMYHNGTLMTEATTGAAETFAYDASTGYVTMYVDTFSPFSAVYDLPVAAIGSTVYYNLETAIAAVQDNGTITLLTDITNAQGISIDTKKAFTIDFNGHTYTVNKPGAGSTGTATSAFQLIAGQTITFKNGTIQADADNLTDAVAPAKNIKRFFQSYANVNLIDMTIDGTNIYGTNSVIEFACGTVSITGNTSITAKSGVKAINVDTWTDYYPAGTAVIINTTGTIGDIYLYSEGSGTTYTKSSLNISGGTFGTVTDDGTEKYTYAITGGTFSADPTKYVAEGYKAKVNGTTPETWTVKSKTAPTPVDGVFTVTNNEQLAEVFEELNTNPAYTTGDYTVKLPAGDIGGTWDETKKGWIANVYVIKQWPEWNGFFGNSTNGNNMQTPPTGHTRITVVGSDEGRTNFKGAIMVVGFGYSNGGNYNITADKVKTEIKNLDFDYTNVIGVDEAVRDNAKTSKFGNGAGTYIPILGCGASANLTITGCNFKKIGRIRLGLAQNNNDNTNLLAANGKVQEAKGYCFNPVVSGCTFTDCDTCFDGYFSGAEWSTFSDITATNCDAFINAQQGCTNPIIVSDSNIKVNNYLIRTSNGGVQFTFEDCAIDVSTNHDAQKYSVVVFRGDGNHVITFDDCAFSGTKDVRCISYNTGHQGADGFKVILKGTSPKANEWTSTSADSGYTCTIQDYVAS